jgi:hypothetical protein
MIKLKRARKGSLLALLQAIGPIDLAPRHQPDWTDQRADVALRVEGRSVRRGKRRSR